MHSSTRLYLPMVMVLLVWIVLGIFSILLPGLTWGNRGLMAVVTALAVFVPSYTTFSSKTATVTMAVLSIMLGVGVILNAYCFTAYSGGTPTDPVLNNIDFYRWWNDAIYHIGDDEGTKATANFGFYGYILAGILRIFGKTVGTALIWSMLLMLTSVLVVGALTYKITQTRIQAALGMICFSSVCYMLSMGTFILKDAFVILAFAIAAYGLNCRKFRFLFLVLLSALMILMSRRNFLLPLILGIGIISFRRGNRKFAVIGAIIIFIIWFVPQFYGYNAGLDQLVTTDVVMGVRFDSPQQMALYKIIGDYSQLSIIKKILLLPLTATVQFFIPFPWNFTRDFDGGFTMLYAHISYLWYIFGFIAMYFFVSRWRDFFNPIYLTAIFGVICWLIPAFLFAGTISRYGLCAVALMAPAVAQILYNNLKSRKFYTWFATYAVVVCVVLLVAHHLQMAAMQ